MKKAILLNNLGTPDSPSPQNVGKYLKEFLMDPDLIRLPFVARWVLVNLIIVPRRKHSSAKNYKKIWTKRGSPLLYHSVDVKEKLQDLMPDYSVEICMRYGYPSIAYKVEKLVEQGCKHIDFIPLYPQYSSATNRSSINKFLEVMKNHPNITYNIKEYFYEDPDYIQASVNLYKKHLDGKKFDHYLFSFHGLPKKDVMKEGPNHCQVVENCCFIECEQQKKCYVSHCKKTAIAIAEKLEIPKDKYTVCFQSRLGPSEWIQPYTEPTAIDMAKNGVKSLAVFSPSFVADCLETLEELDIGLREVFFENGGEDFMLLPCLNSEDEWAEALSKISNLSQS